MDKRTRNEIIRFSASGILINATDIGGYLLLIHFLPYGLSKAVSFTTAGVVGYLINKYWTFESGRASFAQAGRYALANGLAFGINLSANQGVLALWPGAVYPALTAATLLTGLFMFIALKKWVFVLVK